MVYGETGRYSFVNTCIILTKMLSCTIQKLAIRKTI